MIGIENIGIWLAANYQSNYDLKDRFGIDDYFIKEKIGVEKVAQLNKDEDIISMCIGAFDDLQRRTPFDINDIDVMVVVTQNPSSNIPHTSGVLHGKLGFASTCACFDISLGCSGFVYALSVIQAFIKENGLKKGLLFTADPYSKIIDPDDKNTRLLFGDGATVTLIGSQPVWETGKFTFGTLGHLSDALTCSNNLLSMNGRGIFDFAARNIPKDVEKMLKINGINKEDVDLFVVHQGSKYIVDTLAKKMKLQSDKIPFKASAYGNTVSSSIPIILQEYLENTSIKRMVISGFGVGLSYASTVLKTINY